jgi:hypothetical protein
MTTLMADSAQSLERARMTTSYSTLLFVHWNSSLPAYLSFMPDGEVRMATIPTPVMPQAPFVLMVQIGSETYAML